MAGAILFTQLSRFRPSKVVGSVDSGACLPWWHQARTMLLHPEHTDGNSKVCGGSDNAWASRCMWTYSSWVNGWQSFTVVPSARTSLSLSQRAVGEDWVCGRSNTACSTMFQTCTQLYWCQVSAVYSKNLGSALWRAVLAIGACNWSSDVRVTTSPLPGLYVGSSYMRTKSS